MSESTADAWKKSTLSNNGDCVEWAVSADGGRIFVRDSKNPLGPSLTFNAKEWTAFIRGIKQGEGDL